MQEAGQTIDGKTIERRIATLASEKYLAELEAAGHAAGVSRLPFDDYYDDEGGF